ANILAAAIDAGSSAEVYTTSTGTSWTAAPNQPPSPAWDPRVIVSPTANQLLLSTVLAYETHNWGNTWNSFSYVGMHPDVRSFYWGSFQGANYLWLTTDGSSSSGAYAASGDYASLVFALGNPDRAYARTCDGASFARTDNAYSALTAAGVVWSSITPAAPNYLPEIWSENMIAVDPLNQNHVCFANSMN